MAISDDATEFDTLAVARRLKPVGVDSRQAETQAEALRDSRAGLATKADLEAGLATLGAGLRADLYRALWLQTGIIVGTIIAARLLG